MQGSAQSTLKIVNAASSQFFAQKQNREFARFVVPVPMASRRYDQAAVVSVGLGEILHHKNFLARSKDRPACKRLTFSPWMKNVDLI